MAMSQKDRQQLMGLLIVVGIAASGYMWFMWRPPHVQTIADSRAELDSLNGEVQQAVQSLREGSVGDLRQRVGGYERTLVRMRQLVPTQDEVTNLIDQVSTRAQLRGVRMVEWTPLSTGFEQQFRVHRSRFTVAGSYDEIGELLADVASLPRIMVPYEVSLAPEPTACSASDQQPETCLRVTFQLRTFVKDPSLADSTAVGGSSGS
jgi:Tfp pilus assembly protein PilO